MKRSVAVFLVVLSFALLFGCRKSAQSRELTVFAASSLTEPLTEIAEQYRDKHPEVQIVFNFDSSGTLQKQIETGAGCDLFLSASSKQMDALTVVEQATRRNLLENKVVLCVAADNPKAIASLDDLAARLPTGDFLLAVGNTDVPVGQYTQRIFDYYGLKETRLVGHLTYGSSAKEVTALVSEGAADCGILYATDASAAGLTVVDTATADQCGQVIYPAAVLTTAANSAEAKDFLDFLSSDHAAAAWERAGFTRME